MNLPDSQLEQADRLRLPRSVRVLGLASLLNDSASEMVYPLLPHFLFRFLGGNTLHLGLIEGVADSVASIVKLWSGEQSDRAGRRKGFIVFGYSVPALVRPLLTVVVAPWQMFAIRTIDRFGKGVRSAPRDAMIADVTAHTMRGRAFGYQRAMDNLGAAIGPLLAALFLWIWPEQLRTLFLITLLPGVLVVGLVLLGLQESRALYTQPREPFRLSLKPFDRNYRLYLLALVVFTLGNASDTFLLVRADELGVSTALLPPLWGVCHVAKSASNVLLGRMVDRFGARRLLLLGWLVFAAVYAALGAATEVWHVWAGFVAYGIVFGLIETAERTLVAQLVGLERKGLAYGWYNFAIGIATLPASVLFGALYYFGGPLAAFGWGAVLSLAAAVILFGVSTSKASSEGASTPQ